jgi:hypothetical protein
MGLRDASSVQGTRGEGGEAAESRVLFSDEVFSDEVIVRSFNEKSQTKDDRFIVCLDCSPETMLDKGNLLSNG